MSRTGARTRVLVVGLDGMDPELMLRWCESGDLPALAKIRAEGTWGRLDTPEGLADDAVWASFATGVAPGNHGKYSDYQFNPTSYVDDYVGARQLSRNPFWMHLSDAGCRVAILDVPKCPLTPSLNGIQLVDWRVHGRGAPTRSYPPELASNVIEEYGDDRNDIVRSDNYLCGYAELSEQNKDVLHDRLLESIDKKRQMLQAFIKRESWDLFLAVFKESHCAGHHFWQPPEGSDLHTGTITGGTEPINRLKSVYKALDQAIGRLLEETGKETTVLIFSDLGMRDNVTGNDLLETVLLRLEPKLLFSLWELAYSSPTKGRVRHYLDRINRRLRTERSAFKVNHNEISGSIRLNVKGRESRGRLAPGPELDQALDELEQELRNLKDPLSKKPIVDAVIRTERSFPGTAAGNLPDLLVIWRRDLPISGAQSKRVGTVVNPPVGRRPGNHVPGGIFFARGPTQGLGELNGSNSIADLAPTISALLGVSLAETDGKPIPVVVGQSDRSE